MSFAAANVGFSGLQGGASDRVFAGVHSAGKAGGFRAAPKIERPRVEAETANEAPFVNVLHFLLSGVVEDGAEDNERLESEELSAEPGQNTRSQDTRPPWGALCGAPPAGVPAPQLFHTTASAATPPSASPDFSPVTGNAFDDGGRRNPAISARGSALENKPSWAEAFSARIALKSGDTEAVTGEAGAPAAPASVRREGLEPLRPLSGREQFDEPHGEAFTQNQHTSNFQGIWSVSKNAEPAPEATPRRLDAAPALPEEMDSSRAAQAPKSTPASELTVRVGTPDTAQVDVQIRRRSGELHVSVRTPDPGLQVSLRRELPELVNSLDRAGYRSEMFTPLESKPRVSAQDASSNGSSHSGPDGDGNGGSRGNGQGAFGQPSQHPSSGGGARHRERIFENWMEHLEG